MGTYAERHIYIKGNDEIVIESLARFTLITHQFAWL